MSLLLSIIESFNAQNLLFGDEDYQFVPAVIFRSLVMFVIVLVSLRILGKRGVKQLSIFELVIILTLGSAAGDPMFYNDVGLLVAAIVFLTVVGLYRLVVHIADTNSRFNELVEGKPVCLIEDGTFCYSNFVKEPIGIDEFLSELRLEHVSQLGQISRAYLETSGEISIFFYPDEEVKYGLPIFPEIIRNCFNKIEKPGYYACVHCGFTLTPAAPSVPECPTCGKNKWVEACDDRRIG